MTLKTAAERAFTLDDQLAFARLSGDWNPIHLDPVFARRTIAGQVVVHGMHAALWALEVWVSSLPQQIRLRAFKASFVRPMPLNALLRVAVTREQDSSVTIDILHGESLAATLEAHWVRDDRDSRATPANAGLPLRSDPVEWPFEAISGCAGTFSLQFDPQAASVLLPSLAAALPAGQIASLASASRVVGVECPGLHSLLSEVDLVERPAQASGDVGYRVAHVDARFRLVRLQIETPAFTGTIGAFLRRKPAVQASSTAVRQVVQPDEFAGATALVVGGSRGLGELVAKVLAAGGADVTLTYHQGEADAQRVVSDIVSDGGMARAIQFDVLDRTQQLPGSVRPGFLYYFASPFIFSGSKEHFSPELLTQFYSYYVTGFEHVVETLAGRGLTRAFYPSSVALDEMPLEMREYVMAKGAGEALCAALEKRFAGVGLFSPRLPRMDTDQTVTQLPIKNADPLPVMLTMLRSFHGRAD